MFRLIYYANIPLPSFSPFPLSYDHSHLFLLPETCDPLCKLMTLLTIKNNHLSIHSDLSIRGQCLQFLQCFRHKNHLISFDGPHFDFSFTFLSSCWLFSSTILRLGRLYVFSMVQSIILAGTHFMTHFRCFARGNHSSA